MALRVIEAPELEPITLDEAKQHLRVINDQEDNLIESLIAAARQYCESVENKAYYTQKVRLTLDAVPEFPLEIPRPPLQSVEKIEFKNAYGDLVEWDDDNYFVDTDSEPGRIVRTNDSKFPNVDLYVANAFQVTVFAGYDDIANIPDTVKAAIKLLIAHWFENRESVVAGGQIPYEIQNGVSALLRLDRVWPV